MMIFKQIVFLAVIGALFILNGGALVANDDERALIIKNQDRHPAYSQLTSSIHAKKIPVGGTRRDIQE